MTNGMEPVSGKGNGIMEFTVHFWNDRVSIDGKVLPVGQVSTDVLNLSDEQIFTLRQKTDETVEVLNADLFNTQTPKDLVSGSAVREKLEELLDSIMTLPPYKHMNGEFASNLLSETTDSEFLTGFMKKLTDIPEELNTFRVNVCTMLDSFFERVKRRNAEHYALAVNDFLSDRELQEKIADLLSDDQKYQFLQDRNAQIGYTAMPDPEEPQKYVVAERMVWGSIASFLHADFFRGLMKGNVPRRCHNCGKFFLLMKAYNICYCLNIAPGDTRRTCREVGAHKKEARREGKTPARLEYEKVYNRLKVRRSRGKLSTDKWKAAVAEALAYKKKNEAGEISDLELKDIYDKM